MAFTIPNWTNNTGGVEVLLAEGVRQYPAGFIHGILIFFYLVIMGGGFFAQERKVGAGNFWMWMSIAGVIVCCLAFILLIYDNLVDTGTVIIYMVITIVSALFFLTGDR